MVMYECAKKRGGGSDAYAVVAFKPKQNLNKCLYICLFLKYKFIKDQHSCTTMHTVGMTRGITPDITEDLLLTLCPRHNFLHMFFTTVLCMIIFMINK